MIGGIFHKGSGLGDQLFRYVTSKVIAEEKRFKHGMVAPNLFKGSSFMRIPLENGMNVGPEWKFWFEKDIRDSQGIDIRSFDPESQFIEDNTIIDGNFEDEKYWGHRLKDIRTWLEVDAINVPDDVCVVGFRGGEYYTDPDLGLPKEYWVEAVNKMIGRVRKFEVHTDDPETAKAMLGAILPQETAYIQDIGINWRSMRFAKHAIIANSAFYIIPRLLKHSHSDSITISPRYWARRNTQTWARPAAFYKAFQYL